MVKGRAKPDSYEGYSDVKKEMERDYCEGLEVTEGSRYWKIISDKRGSIGEIVSLPRYS